MVVGPVRSATGNRIAATARRAISAVNPGDEMGVDHQSPARDSGQGAVDHATGDRIDAVSARLDTLVGPAALEALDLSQWHRQFDVHRRIRPESQPAVVEADERAGDPIAIGQAEDERPGRLRFFAGRCFDHPDLRPVLRPVAAAPDGNVVLGPDTGDRGQHEQGGGD